MLHARFKASATSLCLFSSSVLSGMPSSLPTPATRAFVKGFLILILAQICNLELTVKRNPSKKDLLKACKRGALKARPDKGGADKDFKTLR